MYIPDRYKAKGMRDKVIIENGGTLRFVSDCYKDKKKKCDNAYDNYAHTLRIVSECYKTYKMCNKAVSTYLSATQFVR